MVGRVHFCEGMLIEFERSEHSSRVFVRVASGLTFWTTMDFRRFKHLGMSRPLAQGPLCASSLSGFVFSLIVRWREIGSLTYQVAERPSTYTDNLALPSKVQTFGFGEAMPTREKSHVALAFDLKMLHISWRQSCQPELMTHTEEA